MAKEPYEYSVNPNNWGPGEITMLGSDEMHEVVDRIAMVMDSFKRNIADYPGIQEEFPELHNLMVRINYDIHYLFWDAKTKMFALRKEEEGR